MRLKKRPGRWHLGRMAQGSGAVVTGLIASKNHYLLSGLPQALPEQTNPMLLRSSKEALLIRIETQGYCFPNVVITLFPVVRNYARASAAVVVVVVVVVAGGGRWWWWWWWWRRRRRWFRTSIHFTGLQQLRLKPKFRIKKTRAGKMGNPTPTYLLPVSAHIQQAFHLSLCQP